MFSIPSRGVFTAYSGASIIPVINVPGRGGIVIGEIQTLTYSTHTERRPGRVLGSRRVRGFASGPRTVAGTIIFTVFDKHVVRKLAPRTGAVSLFDEMPPFDITVGFKAEDGRMARLAIIGVRVVDEGQVMSIDDLIIENTVSYIAEDIIPLEEAGRKVEMVPDVAPAPPEWPEAPIEPEPAVSSKIEVVATAGDKPVSGAKVEVWDSLGPIDGARGVTDKNGRLVLTVPFEGIVGVTGFADGHEARVGGVVASASYVARVELEFPEKTETVKITGKVWSALSNAWLSGASVHLTVSGKVYSAVTDGAGAYSVAVPRGRLTRIEVSANLHGPYKGEPPGGPVDVVKDTAIPNIPLYPVAKSETLSGKVLCASGEPIGGATITVGFQGGGTVSAVSLQDGTWKAAVPSLAVVASIRYDARMHKPLTQAYSVGIRITGDKAVGVVRLQPSRPYEPPAQAPSASMERGAPLAPFSGKVTDAKGQPIPHCMVECVQTVNGIRHVFHVETNENGYYGFSAIYEQWLATFKFTAVGYKELELAGANAVPAMWSRLNVTLEEGS